MRGAVTPNGAMALLLLLLLPLLAAVFWWHRRGATLTRACRWRLDRRVGPGHWACASCGATCDLPPGQEPRRCLRATATEGHG